MTAATIPSLARSGSVAIYRGGPQGLAKEASFVDLPAGERVLDVTPIARSRGGRGARRVAVLTEDSSVFAVTADEPVETLASVRADRLRSADVDGDGLGDLVLTGSGGIEVLLDDPRAAARGRPMKTALARCTALAVLVFAGSALADGSQREQAEQAYEAGDRAYAAGEYLAAARAYENAYALFPLPSITFSTAQAYRRHYAEDPDVRWLERAQSLYRRYLAEQPSGERRAHAITHIGNIDLLLAARANEERPPEEKRAPPTELLISSATPRAAAAIDGAPPADVPVVRAVTPGKHRVKLHAPGFFEAELDVLAVEGRLTIVPHDLKERPGTLRIDSAEGASVWVDGQLVARTPWRPRSSFPPADILSPSAQAVGVRWRAR